jgi:hypothetical protein
LLLAADKPASRHTQIGQTLQACSHLERPLQKADTREISDLAC